MWSKEAEVRWQELAEEMHMEMKEWRLLHPRASLKEIEEALDERMAKVRALMLEEIAQSSEAAVVGGARGDDGPSCPECGHMLEGGRQDSRSLTTNYNQTITLKRSYAICAACGTGLFPPG